MYKIQTLAMRNENKQPSRHRETFTVTDVNSDAVLDLLRELKLLRAEGVLSMDEFEAKKRRLLAI